MADASSRSPFWRKRNSPQLGGGLLLEVEGLGAAAHHDGVAGAFRDLSLASASRRSAKKDARVPSASVNSGVLPSAVVMTKRHSIGGRQRGDGSCWHYSSAPAVQAPSRGASTGAVL